MAMASLSKSMTHLVEIELRQILKSNENNSELNQKLGIQKLNWRMRSNLRLKFEIDLIHDRI